MRIPEICVIVHVFVHARRWAGVFVCVLFIVRGEGDVITAGLVLQQGYIPAEHHTNLTQSSHFKQCIFVGIMGLTASSSTLYDYTASGHEGTVGCIYIYTHTHTYMCIQYTYISIQYIYLFCDAINI